jgi:hypothetical protein
VTVIDPKILEQLKAIGIEVPPEGGAVWLNLKSVDVSQLPSMKARQEALMKIRDLLKAELEDSLVKLDNAYEQLERSKNGGGV